MNRTEHNPDVLLDAAIAEVANDPIDPRVVEEAGRRAWARIAAAVQQEQVEEPAPKIDHIRSCADFQALIPEYRAGQLTLARRMLIEDHIHECVACRRAMHSEPSFKPAVKVVEMPRRAWTPKRWAIAAMVLIGVGSSVWFGYERFGPAPSGSRATLVAADGGVFRLDRGKLLPVSVGAAFAEGDRLRTSTAGHAVVRLMDGSTVEVGDRAELSVSADRRNTTVYLGRGRIIVQAAKRNRGHLYVAAGDSRVAVTGTVFSVNRGVAGSRVSVIEGEVHVEQGDNETVLHAGDQKTTHPSIGQVPVVDDIAWSRNFDQHVALLRQFVDLKQKLEAVRMPGLRYSSRLLDGVPAASTMYISLPNVGRAVADMDRLVKDQAAQSPEFRQWIDRQLPHLEQITSRVTQLSEYIGDEVAIAFQPCNGFCGVLMAEVTRPGLREFLAKEAAKLDPEHAGPPIRMFDGPQAPTGARGVLLAGFHANRVAIGEDPALVEAALRGGSAFASTEFGHAIGDVYKRGTSLLLAVDLQRLASRDTASLNEKDRTVLARVGINDVRYLIAEQRTFDNRSEYSASVNFAPVRTGMAAWLAEPGPVGSLSFVSPNAQFATSFVVRNASQMLDDVMKSVGSQNGARGLDDFRNTVGVDLEKDLVAALGGEATFAFDGPMLPTPSWKIIIEVNDPARLQATIDKLVQTANRTLQEHGEGTRVEVTSSQAVHQSRQGVWAGQAQEVVTHVVKTGMTFIPEIHYAFVDGYLVMTPSDSLLARTISDRLSGVSLTRSRRFTRLLPRNQQPNFSAMVYQNAGELLGLLAKGGSAVTNTTPDQQRQVEEIAGRVEPMLVCAYGEKDRIEIASQGSAWSLLLNSFAGQLLSGQQQHSRGTQRHLKSYR